MVLAQLVANPEIAEKLLRWLPLGKASSRQLDGEIMINIEESARGDDSPYHPPY